MIHVTNLKKSYKEIEAVKGISFHVEQGAFLAFLGPNGAGKSTTINILCTLLEKDQGEVVIDGLTLGQDDAEIRKRIGVVFQQNVLDKKLSVYENLEIRGSFYGLSKQELKKRIDELSVQLTLGEILNQKYGTLSGGQRRRVDIARALIHRPKILFLDEPTTGLDPQARKNVWEVIDDLRKDNMTIFLTTHYMEETLQASNTIIIYEGEIHAEGSPDSLRRQHSKDYIRLEFQSKEGLMKLEELQIPYKAKDGIVTVHMESLQAIDLLNKLKEELVGFEVLRGSMDDVFMTVTGSELRE